jgi:hypothetical protein
MENVEGEMKNEKLRMKNENTENLFNQFTHSSLTQCPTPNTQDLSCQLEQVPIEEIKVGDWVLSKDENTGEIVYKPVTELFLHQVDTLFTLTLETGEVIETTWNHPFRKATSDKRGAVMEDSVWIEAKDIQAGDALLISKGYVFVKSNIQKYVDNVDVYNFEVDGTHSYFVSGAGVWVHNYESFDPFTLLKVKGAYEKLENTNMAVRILNRATFGVFNRELYDSQMLTKEFEKSNPLMDSAKEVEEEYNKHYYSVHYNSENSDGSVYLLNKARGSSVEFEKSINSISKNIKVSVDDSTGEVTFKKSNQNETTSNPVDEILESYDGVKKTKDLVVGNLATISKDKNGTYITHSMENEAKPADDTNASNPEKGSTSYATLNFSRLDEIVLPHIDLGDKTIQNEKIPHNGYASLHEMQHQILASTGQSKYGQEVWYRNQQGEIRKVSVEEIAIEGRNGLQLFKNEEGESAYSEDEMKTLTHTGLPTICDVRKAQGESKCRFGY